MYLIHLLEIYFYLYFLHFKVHLYVQLFLYCQKFTYIVREKWEKMASITLWVFFNVSWTSLMYLVILIMCCIFSLYIWCKPHCLSSVNIKDWTFLVWFLISIVIFPLLTHRPVCEGSNLQFGDNCFGFIFQFVFNILLKLAFRVPNLWEVDLLNYFYTIYDLFS